MLATCSKSERISLYSPHSSDRAYMCVFMWISLCVLFRFPDLSGLFPISMYLCMCVYRTVDYPHQRNAAREEKVFLFGEKEKMKMYSYYQSSASGKCVAMNIVQTEKWTFYFVFWSFRFSFHPFAGGFLFEPNRPNIFAVERNKNPKF